MATGVVTGVHAGHIDVELEPPPRCKGCDGACLWYRLPATQRASFDTSLDFTVGAAVTVALPDRYLLLGTLIVYGVPLIAILVGAALGMAAVGGDLGAATGAVLTLAAGLVVVRALRRRFEQATLRQIKVLRAS